MKLRRVDSIMRMIFSKTCCSAASFDETFTYRISQPQVCTSFRCRCTLSRMPMPMNSVTIAVPP